MTVHEIIMQFKERKTIFKNVCDFLHTCSSFVHSWTNLYTSIIVSAPLYRHCSAIPYSAAAERPSERFDFNIHVHAVHCIHVSIVHDVHVHTSTV